LRGSRAAAEQRPADGGREYIVEIKMPGLIVPMVIGLLPKLLATGVVNCASTIANR